MDKEKRQGKSKKADRTKYYAFVMYPDSAPDNWKQLLDEMHVPVLVSPLHDNDVNPNGTLKKPHWHVIIMFGSLKSKEQFAEFRDRVNGVGCETVHDLKAYARYLIHRDNPEKAQYKREDVTEICGADFDTVILSENDDFQMLADMVQYCVDNDIHSFAKFVMICKANNQQWFKALCRRTTYFMDKFIKSLAWSSEHHCSVDDGNAQKKMFVVDPDTGDIVKEIYV